MTGSAPAGGRAGRWLRDLTDGGPVFALLILFGLNLVPQMDSTAFGILVPNIRDAFGMSDAGVLSLVAVAALVGLSFQVPIAQVADRHDRVRLMLLGAAVFTAFSFGTGLAFTVWVLAIMRSGSGIGMATIGPTHNSLIADYYPINARPRVYAFHYGALAVGGILGPVVGGLLAAAFNWRAPFLVFAVPGVILILLGFRLQNPSRGIQEREAMGLTDAAATEEPPPSFAEGWRMTWKIESLRRIFYALPFLAASLIGFSALASILYENRFHLGVVDRGWVAAAAEPAQIVGLVVGARVGSRLIERDPGLILRFLAVVAAVCAGLLAVFALAPVLWVTIAVNMAVSASLAAVGAGIYSSLSLAIPARSRSLGFSMGALWVIPGLVVLPVIGAVSDAVSVEVGMLVLVPVFLIGGLILSTAGNVIDRDIAQVRTLAAARSEVLWARRQGLVKLLHIRDLNVAYGPVQVLFDVGMDIGEGEVVALLGTNGAGKSTLLKAICGVVEADKGAVIFDGRDITHAPPNEIAALGITQVPGGEGVFPGLTVAENLRVAGWLDRRQKERAAERSDEVLALFPGLAARLGEVAANLSGGQQQMLALSMAFLARPQLLAIDELSLGLAPIVVEELLPVIELIAVRGYRRHPGRAVGQSGPDRGTPGLLHGEGGDPLPRGHRRSVGPARHPAVGLPPGCCRPSRGAAGRGRRSRPDPPPRGPGCADRGRLRRSGRRSGRPGRRGRADRTATGAGGGRRHGAVRRHRGRGWGQPLGAGRRDPRYHRPERRRQDHAVRPHFGVHPMRLGLGAPRRPRRHTNRSRPPGPAGPRPLLPGRASVPGPDRHRDHRRGPGALGPDDRPPQRRVAPPGLGRRRVRRGPPGRGAVGHVRARGVPGRLRP